MGEIVDLDSAGEADQAQPSTGVVKSGDIVVRGISGTTALITQSEWCEVKSLQDEACMLFRNLVGTIQNKPSTESGHSTNSPTKTEEVTAPMQHTVASPSLAFRILHFLALVLSIFNPFKQGCQKTSQQDTLDKPDSTQQDMPDSIQQDMPEVLAMFKDAMESPYWNDMKRMFKAYLRVEDTGGQPELMDMLPALTLGPGIYLLFINLQHDLDHYYKLTYCDASGKSTSPVESTYTVKEMLLSSLSSITCSNAISSMRCKDEKEATIPGMSSVQNSSKSVAYIVGTHKDKASEEDIKEINKELRKVIESSYFYEKDIVQFYSEEEVIIPVNNQNGGPEEVKKIKMLLEEGMEKHFKNQKIPAIWLFFSLLLRNKDERTASYAFCKQLSELLKMTHDETKVALWFLHHHVGILMYFPNVPELEDLVIIDVQVVYDSVTILILKAMRWDKIGHSRAQDFKRTGQFMLSRIIALTSEVSGDLIPPRKLVALLEYLHIIAKILTPQQPSSMTSSNNEASNEEVVYIMPCVLNNATREELDSKKQPHEVSPIMVRFKCGFVPIGVFPALVACLISNKSFTLIQEGIFKDVVQFRYGTQHTLLTFICRSMYLEVIISEFVSDNAEPPEPHMECAAIKSEIESSFNTISHHVNYGSLTDYQFAFECSLHTENSREHLCVVEKTETMPKFMFCLLSYLDPKPIPLPSEHKVWFDQVSTSV